MVIHRNATWRILAFVIVLPAVGACFSIDDLSSYPCAADGTCPTKDAACIDGTCYKFDLSNSRALVDELAKFRCANHPCPHLNGRTTVCLADTCVVVEAGGGCADFNSIARSPAAVAPGSSEDRFCSFPCDSLRPCPGNLRCNAKHVCEECTEDSHCGAGKCCARRSAEVSGCYPTDHTPTFTECTGVPQPTAPCDVVKQDCPAGKCTVVAVDRAPNTNRCVAVTGAKGLLDSCTRTKLGVDDCAKGLLCSARPPGSRTVTRCLALCSTDGECDVAGGSACFDEFSTSNAAGTCSPTCSPFAPSCAEGSYCVLNPDPHGQRLLPYCTGAEMPSAQRNLPVGSACTSFDQCQTGMGCEAVTVGAPTKCVRYCDATHPCPPGPAGACTPIPKAGNGIGACP